MMTQTKWIADNAITAAKINTSALGNGLQGGGGTALSVKPKTLSGIAVDGDGVAVVVNNTTVELNGSGQLGVKASSITSTQMDLAGNFTWTGIHNFNSGTVTVPTITGASNANAPTTKAYVDSLAEGISWKNYVSAATVGADITLSGEQTIDTVALVAGNRVLVKDQTDGTENGLYEVSTTAWVRTADANTNPELIGAAVMVAGGSANINKQFIQTNPAPDIGVNDITFVQFGGGQTYTAGIGLLLTGSVFSVKMGAGLKELPAGEVGIDLATNSGLTVGSGLAGDQLAIDPDTETGATVVPLNLNSNGAGTLVDNATVYNDSGTLKVKADGINETHIDFGSGANQVDSSSVPVDTTYTPTNYTPSITYAGITNHLKGIDTAIAGVSTEATKQVGHTITVGETTAGYIDISGWTFIPKNAQSVRIFPLGGPEQANYSVVSGLSGVTPDFEVDLTTDAEKIIINAAGGPTVTLSGDLTTSDNIVVAYVA
jgi:hypothetical protein